MTPTTPIRRTVVLTLLVVVAVVVAVVAAATGPGAAQDGPTEQPPAGPPTTTESTHEQIVDAVRAAQELAPTGPAFAPQQISACREATTTTAAGDNDVLDLIEVTAFYDCATGELGVEVVTYDAWFDGDLGLLEVGIDIGGSPGEGCNGAELAVLAVSDPSQGLTAGVFAIPYETCAVWVYEPRVAATVSRPDDHRIVLRWPAEVVTDTGVYALTAYLTDTVSEQRLLADRATVHFDLPTPPIGGGLRLVAREAAIDVSGWAADTDGHEPIEVEILLDGVPVATASARQHTDVDVPGSSTSSVGFEATIPADPGTHEVCVLAPDREQIHPPTHLGCATTEVAPGRRPFGFVETAEGGVRSVTVSGWAVDLDGDGPVTIEFRIDGDLVGTTTTGIARPDVEAEHPEYGPDPGYTATFDAPPGTPSVCVHALNSGPAASEQRLECRRVEVGSDGFVPIAPQRMADTRSRSSSARMLTAGTVLELGNFPRDIPDHGVGALALSVTAIGPAQPGFLTVYPCDQPRPLAASLNYLAGDTVSNMVIARVPAPPNQRRVCIYTHRDLNVVVDVMGWWPSGTEVVPLLPARVLDTRDGTGSAQGIVAAGQTVELQVAGNGGVPTDGAGTVALNVAATGSTGAGFVTVYPCDTQRPLSAGLNYQPGRTTPNLVVTRISATGTVCLYTHADVHLVADVQAWWPAGTRHTAVTPVRVLDTRESQPSVRLGSGETMELDLTASGAIPGRRADAVSLNVAAAAPLGRGFLTVYPCDQDRPPTGNLTYAPGRTASSHVLAALADDGKVCIYALTAVHVVVDLQGWWTSVGPTLVPGAADERYAGVASALDGDSVAVLAHRYDGATQLGRTVRVHRLVEGLWIEESRIDLPASDPDTATRTLALDADTLVVGSPDAGGHAGAASVYVRSGGSWSAHATIGAGVASPGDRLGWAVAVDGDTMVLGAPGDPAGSQAGSAAVFRRSADVWALESVLAPTDPAGVERFGSSVAISGDTVAVGFASAPGDGPAAAVYTRTGTQWDLSGTVSVPDPLSGGGPSTVALDGTTIVVGDPSAGVSQVGDGAGAVHVFELVDTTWEHRATFRETRPGQLGRFGAAVAVDGDHVVIGAPRRLDGFAGAGQVTVLARTGAEWQVRRVFAAPAGDRVGTSVDVSGARVVAGQPTSPPGPPSPSGGVWVFELPT